MIAPNDLFNIDNLISHTNLFKESKLVWEALDYITFYISDLIEQKGSTTIALRKYGDMLTRTIIIYENKIYFKGFKFINTDQTKEKIIIYLNGEKLTTATIIYAGAVFMDDKIYIAPGVVIESGAVIKGPTYISSGSKILHGSYLRGSCLVGKNCIVGHSTEIKNSVLLDGAKASHFAYIGDSILGQKVNLGAGTKLANLKIIDRPIKIKIDNFIYLIPRRKFGAIIGDNCQTGCNTVINPGTILGQQSLVAPCKSVPSGYYPPRSIIR